MGASDLIDLDFTVSRAPAARPAERAAPKAESEIGAQRPGKGSNSITYVRGGVPRSAAAPDAPILVVEDDPDTRNLLERVLAREGHAVRTAGDGQEFVQAIRQRPLPKLILLDVELPRISGFRILTFLRQEPLTSAIPVVMVTARSENKDLVQGITLGADGYLSKPVSFDALRTVVAKVLQGG
jgi:CheY-like chemotaxis protein